MGRRENMKLKEKYHNDFNIILDRYETKKDALIKKGIYSETIKQDLVCKLSIWINRMLEEERK